MLAVVTALAGCAYEYDDGFASGTESAPAPAFTDAALPRDPSTRWPVSGAELDAWLAEVLPATEGQVFHTGYGTLEADEVREETTAPLPERKLLVDPRLPEPAAGLIQYRSRRTRSWWT